MTSSPISGGFSDNELQYIAQNLPGAVVWGEENEGGNWLGVIYQEEKYMLSRPPEVEMETLICNIKALLQWDYKNLRVW